MNFLFIIIQVFSFSLMASESLTKNDLDFSLSDGQEPVQMDGSTYSISNEGTLLRNDVEMTDLAGRNIPFVKKIYSIKLDGMKHERLMVFFHSEDNRIFGHKRGIYYYNPNFINDWDHIGFGEKYFKDVTFFHGKVLAICSGSKNNYFTDDICDQRELSYSTESTFFESGSMETYAINFSPLHFINKGDKLFIMGEDNTGKTKKYIFNGVGMPPIDVSTLSEKELFNL